MQTETEDNGGAVTVASTKMDYDELTLNPLLAEMEAESMSANEQDAKNKTRRYWSPKEEERFFEIWGRDNWRLTKHGKNTIYFAQWADELKERHNIDVKPEEIQAKVNQTRAKFRQVKKLLESDKNAVRWKKYDIIERILKNQYRSKDDEPVPQQALENNRDLMPTTLVNVRRSASPNGVSAVSQQQDNGLNQNQLIVQESLDVHKLSEEANRNNVTLSVHNLPAGIFHNDSDSHHNYNTELFSDQVDVKSEYDDEMKRDDYSNDYHHTYSVSYNVEQHATNYAAHPTVRQQHNVHAPLHPMQTTQQQHQPQQQQQQQLQPQHQQHQQQQQQQPQHHTQYQEEMLRSQHQNSNPSPVAHNYEHSNNNSNSNSAHLLNNQNHQIHPSYDTSNTQNYNNNSTYNNNHTAMQPPRPTSVISQPRKRRAPSISSAAGSSRPPASDSLEALYLDEVRKKNLILDEQRDISRKRMQLEERKLSLMEEFFPKYLSLQQQILQKLDCNGHNN